MSKQTAVDWLYKTHFFKNGELTQSDFEQAKAMEREQIINAHLTGLIYSLDMPASEQSVQYYNETYK